MPYYAVFNNVSDSLNISKFYSSETIDNPNYISISKDDFEYPGYVFVSDTGTIERAPLNHDPSSVFDFASKSWVVDLNILRSIKIDQINKQKIDAEYSGFIWDGSKFDSDLYSQSKIQGAAQAAIQAKLNNENFSINWTLADNTVRTLSETDVLNLHSALINHVNEQHQKAVILKKAINSALTAEEINSIIW